MNLYQLFLFICLFKTNGIMIQLNSFFDNYNNGLFRSLFNGYFFVAFCFYVSKYNNKIKNNNYFFCIILGVVINLIFTYFQLRSIHKFDDIQVEMYFGSVLLAISLFMICLNNKLVLNSKYKILRNLSSTIYYTHFAIISAYKIILSLFNVENTILNKYKNKYIKKII